MQKPSISTQEARSLFLTELDQLFSQGKKATVRELRSIAVKAGIDPRDEKYLWELAELAWTLHYRTIVNQYQGRGAKETFAAIVDFYRKVQPSFTGTDSVKKIFQQYSTSAPIAYLAGWFTDQDKPNARVLEPSAGNGLLTIYYPREQVVVNDLDRVRFEHLSAQGFATVLQRDASEPFPVEYRRNFDVVLSNPPFGKLGEVNRDFGFGFRLLDHIMLAHALDCLKDTGRAAVIIGGHTAFGADGHVVAYRPFFNWLCRHYNVVDMLNINSEKLYAKQGTTYPLRMLLIAGRKTKPFGRAANVFVHPLWGETVNSFDELFTRVAAARERATEPFLSLDDLLRREATKLELELRP